MAKKISINTLKRAVNDNPLKETHYKIEVSGKPVDIIVTPYLSAEQYIQFVNDIVSGCVNLGEYVPALKELSVISHILGYCTNISTDNVSVIHEFIHRYPDTVKYIYKDFITVFPRFEKDIDETIDYEIKKHLNRSPFNFVAEKILSILDGIEARLTNISKEDITKLTKLVESFSNINEAEIAKVITDHHKSNISSKDIKKI